MAILSNEQKDQLIEAIIDSGIEIMSERTNFLLSINPKFRAILKNFGNARGQLTGDIGMMNDVERLTDGQIPLLIYLQNLALYLSGLAQEETVRKLIDYISHKLSGAPVLNTTNIPELKEVIIYRDDMVTFEFMRAGLQTGASVMKIQVTSYEGGQVRKLNNAPMIFLGTGWLISDSLVLTNHHVINARKDNEVNAKENDLRLQGEKTLVLFDFDEEDVPGIKIKAIELVAWDVMLDYALIRIAPSNRAPLKCVTQKTEASATDLVPVNIIQHPNGKSKRYGIRNNLVSGFTETDLRYFTDTDSGSSGSPVLNDLWQVVALHKAALFVSKVNFQGKTSAYVNIGTHITLILEHLKANYPEIHGEINL